MQSERSAACIDRINPERLPGPRLPPFEAKARLWFSQAIKHSILQDLLPAIVTGNRTKDTVKVEKLAIAGKAYDES